MAPTSGDDRVPSAGQDVETKFVATVEQDARDVEIGIRGTKAGEYEMAPGFLWSQSSQRAFWQATRPLERWSSRYMTILSRTSGWIGRTRGRARDEPL
jgi:hypothetical protein